MKSIENDLKSWISQKMSSIRSLMNVAEVYMDHIHLKKLHPLTFHCEKNASRGYDILKFLVLKRLDFENVLTVNKKCQGV